MGIFNLVIPIGAALGLILGGILSKSGAWGWRTPFYIFAMPGVVLGILALFMRDYKTVENVDETGKKMGFFTSAIMLFKIPTLKWLYTAYGVRNIMNFSVLAWQSAFLMRSQGIAEDAAGSKAGVVLMMAIFGSLLGGFLSDSMTGPGYIVALLWGACVMIGVPPLTAVTQDVVEPAVKGISCGMCVFCMYVLGGGAEGLKTALYNVALAGFAAAIVEWLGSKTYQADIEKVKGITFEAEK